MAVAVRVIDCHYIAIVIDLKMGRIKSRESSLFLAVIIRKPRRKPPKLKEQDRETHCAQTELMLETKENRGPNQYTERTERSQTAYTCNLSFYCLACLFLVNCQINRTTGTETHADSHLFNAIDCVYTGTKSLSVEHAYLPGKAFQVFYSVVVFAFKKRSRIWRRDAADEQFSSTQAT